MSSITFESFLCGTPATDYIFQDTPYEHQIETAAEFIKKADYVLIGEGDGMSAAAGALYGGEWFRKNMEMVRICRICMVPDFIHIRMKEHTGDTGQNRRCLVE